MTTSQENGTDVGLVSGKPNDKAAARNDCRRQRARGMLAFLHPKVWYFPYDAVKVHKEMAPNTTVRQRKRHRREQQQQQYIPESTAIRIPLAELIDTTTQLVVLCFLDDSQSFSIRIRNRLVELAANYPSEILVVGVGSVDCSDDRELASSGTHWNATFWNHTGLVLTSRTAALRAVLPTVQSRTPALVLLQAPSGQRVAGASAYEELALEGNASVHETALRWLAGESALSNTQQVAAAAGLVPACALL